MNFALIKQGLRYLSVWCALAGVTVLLTVLFSFLGDLSVAVVTGVMLGSARRWYWNAIPVSLVFPAVILVLSYYSKIELPPGKVHLVALICGAAFWGVYGMMFFLHCFEQKQEAPPANPTRGADQEHGKPRIQNSALLGLSLSAMHGCWSCADATTEGSKQRKTLQIEDGKFVLTVSEPGSEPRVIARGDVSVDPSGTEKLVVHLRERRDCADSI